MGGEGTSPEKSLGATVPGSPSEEERPGMGFEGTECTGEVKTARWQDGPGNTGAEGDVATTGLSVPCVWGAASTSQGPRNQDQAGLGDSLPAWEEG